MKLEVYRFDDDGNRTRGILLIDGKYECFTLEDEDRDVKVMHETRIPEGTYKIELREYGGHHNRYSVKFPDMHVGMLQVMDVPGFTDILIHIGNNEKHTSGCLLVGRGVRLNSLVESTIAYQNMYIKVVKAIKRGEPVTITYNDLEKK